MGGLMGVGVVGVSKSGVAFIPFIGQFAVALQVRWQQPVSGCAHSFLLSAKARAPKNNSNNSDSTTTTPPTPPAPPAPPTPPAHPPHSSSSSWSAKARALKNY